MEHYFELSKNHIFLYGYGERSEQIKNNLNLSGIGIKGYIDRNYREISREGVLGYSQLLERYPLKIRNKCVIIFCFQNALEQETVAGSIHEDGFEQIIYLPIGGGSANHIQEMMLDNYMSVCYDDHLDRLLFPKYHLLQNDYLQCYILKQFREEFVVAIKRDKVYVAEDLGLCTIRESQEYNELYNYIFCGKNVLTHYLSWYPDKDKEKFLEERRRLFLIFEEKLQSDSGFFIKVPGLAEYNEKGYFNLRDGHHRACFLSHHVDYIPLLVNRQDLFRCSFL